MQQADDYDNGFEDIDIIPGEHKKSSYFVAQSGKTYDLSSGHRVELRNENFVRGDDEMVQTDDWYDKNLPEDAFKEAPAAPVLKKAPVAGHGAGFTYDSVTGLPVLAGMESDDKGQLDYDSMVQLAKAPKAASGFSYNAKTGLPNVVGDEIDYDHDFVQFQGEPIGLAMKNRNLLQTADNWMDAQADFKIEENIKVPQKKAMPEGIWNTVVGI
jgi:hypothetical protein